MIPMELLLAIFEQAGLLLGVSLRIQVRWSIAVPRRCFHLRLAGVWSGIAGHNIVDR